MSLTPSVGRIVLVTVEPTTNNGADVAPAIITRVWSDSMVNVQVFRDGAHGGQAATSIPLFADRAAVDTARAERVGAALPHQLVTTFMAAYWPPRT
ncbi:hypothetical protein ACWGLE_01095 [Streptomyces sp. NPDC055897]